MWILVFFAKEVLATIIDAIVVKKRMVEYPVRPFPKVFGTNILFDLLFFPILSVFWVQLSYDVKLKSIFLRSLIFSVPMSITQWALEKKTKLFNWKQWSILHTFVSVNFTLFAIRGFVGLLRKALALKTTNKHYALQDGAINNVNFLEFGETTNMDTVGKY